MKERGTLTQAEIDEAFKGTNFGGVDRRKIIEQCVLARACDYYCGHTITQICVGLGFLSPKTNRPTKKGREFMFRAFADPKNSA